ncbi:hypothetical protein MBFIL_04050 [Methanobrevibacter filiformis]|uniref:Phosphatidylglycerol lysyltransferase n=2 Tax=Methanobrevibacter filiformis TaxID=55758 RepID=A0A166EUS8_9EURY|nr:hypothetical protein MBFIL_04050 [Methanobrevibacter filiformis]
MGVMIYFIGIDKIVDALKLANFWYIILAIVVQIITYFLFALRWNIINKTANISVSLKKLVLITLTGLGVNNITPSGRGGGEPVRAYILSKDTNEPFESTFATVVADRSLDTIPFLILAILTIVLMIMNFSLNTWIIVLLIASVIIITLASVILIYMSINQAIAEKVMVFILKIVRFFYKKDPEILEKRIMDAISGFQGTMRVMLKDKNVLYKALPISLLLWLSEIFRVYLVFLAFGSSVSPLVIAEVFIISCLVGMIPLLPGGLGAVDGLMILLFSSAGISPSISAAATVIERLISFWMTTIVGLIILSYYGYSVSEKIQISNKGEEEVLDEFAHHSEDIKELFDDKNNEK